jgi:hypothetical protein
VVTGSSSNNSSSAQPNARGHCASAAARVAQPAIWREQRLRRDASDQSQRRHRAHTDGASPAAAVDAAVALTEARAGGAQRGLTHRACVAFRATVASAAAAAAAVTRRDAAVTVVVLVLVRRRGGGAAYKLDFGAYQGYSLLELIRHANCMTGQKHLLPNPSEDTPPPGKYMLWLASTEFEWQFPRHLKLFFALRALDYQSCRVCDENRGHRPLLVAHCRLRLTVCVCATVTATSSSRSCRRCRR